MKPLLEDIGKKRGNHSFLAFELKKNKLEFYWHYHPEYELTYIINGKGRRLIGDHHEYFESGDLVLIGPGLPHTWVSDSNMKDTCEAVVIQFSAAFIERFTELAELEAINQLLQASKQGVSFRGNASTVIQELIKKLPAKGGIEKVTNLLQILNILSTSSRTPLSSSLYQPLKGSENKKRINMVCTYIQQNATELITLHKAAALVNLSPTAFCKFFKRITGTTFSDYVNEIRIANVCNDLLATDKQIAEIAYANGFETLTYFNRIFLKKKKIRPSDYRKM